jgi:hypothetical protein
VAIDRLKLASDAAEILDRLGISAYGKRSEGRVTLDGFAQVGGRRIAFSYEIDDGEMDAEALAALCVAKVREAVGGDG